LIVYGHRLTSSVDASALHRSNAAGQQVRSAHATPSPNGAAKPRVAAVGTTGAKAAHSPFKRVQVGRNEVDYIAGDVTIRSFAPTPAPLRVRVGERQVDFGQDVTVRYFASKPMAASQERLVPAAAQSVDRSLPTSK
jgi:hypothetical protein